MKWSERLKQLTQAWFWSRPLPAVIDFTQLGLRWLLAYGFYSPFVAKLERVDSFIRWLNRLHFPFPILDAWLVIGLQGAALILLTIGLSTRLFAAVLFFHMMIGLLAVHWPNGFSARANGYEIPLYYALMLLTLIIYGAGRWSVDGWLRHRFERRNPMHSDG